MRFYSILLVTSVVVACIPKQNAQEPRSAASSGFPDIAREDHNSGSLSFALTLEDVPIWHMANWTYQNREHLAVEEFDSLRDAKRLASFGIITSPTAGGEAFIVIFSKSFHESISAISSASSPDSYGLLDVKDASEVGVVNAAGTPKPAEATPPLSPGSPTDIAAVATDTPKGLTARQPLAVIGENRASVVAGIKSYDGRTIYYHWGDAQYLSDMAKEGNWTQAQREFYSKQTALESGLYVSSNPIDSAPYATKAKAPVLYEIILSAGKKAMPAGGARLSWFNIDPKANSVEIFREFAGEGMTNEQFKSLQTDLLNFHTTDAISSELQVTKSSLQNASNYLSERIAELNKPMSIDEVNTKLAGERLKNFDELRVNKIILPEAAPSLKRRGSF